MSPRRPVVVVGGGLAGLTAAYHLAQDGDAQVLVLEGTPEVGGKLRQAEVGGVRVDVGAEAMLARRPEGVELVRELGLPLVHPATAASRIWSRGRLRPLPPSLMGVPLDLDRLASSGVLSPAGLARARAERGGDAELTARLAAGADVSVGDLVADRLGQEVVDRLVEPLLGGVYAGRAGELSVRATVPQLVELAARGSLLSAAAAAAAAGAAALPARVAASAAPGPAPLGPEPAAEPADRAGVDAALRAGVDAAAGSAAAARSLPLFAGVSGGVARVAVALVGSGRFTVRTGAAVREVRRLPATEPDGARFLLTVGPAASPEAVRATDLVLATPAAPTARLLRDLLPTAAADLAAVESASVAVVTLAFRAAELPRLPGSGFLVPPVEGRRIKAATFSFAKWAWVREAGRGAWSGEDVLVLRASLGRHREERTLQAPDAELVAAATADLADLAGVRAPPVDSHVQRWGGALPQYAPGHLERVARVRAAVATVRGLAVCGAAYDGVGIPAVIASARLAHPS